VRASRDHGHVRNILEKCAAGGVKGSPLVHLIHAHRCISYTNSHTKYTILHTPHTPQTPHTPHTTYTNTQILYVNLYTKYSIQHTAHAAYIWRLALHTATLRTSFGIRVHKPTDSYTNSRNKYSRNIISGVARGQRLALLRVNKGAAQWQQDIANIRVLLIFYGRI
jgi:hypothetical protein